MTGDVAELLFTYDLAKAKASVAQARTSKVCDIL